MGDKIMVEKIFEETPSKDFFDDAEKFRQFSSEQFEKLETWLKSREDPFLFKRDEVKDIAKELNVTIFDLEAVLRLTRFLLYQASVKNLSVDNINTELEELKIEPDLRERISSFIGRLFDLRDLAVVNWLTQSHLAAGLPTIRSMGTLVDIRPLFHSEKEEIIGSVPIAILTLRLEAPDAPVARVEFQLGEVALHDFIERLQLLEKQLKQAKMSIRISTGR